MIRSATATGSSEALAVPDAVHVWRTWTLHDDPGTRVPLLKPIAGDRRVWPPRRPARARCTRHRFHRAPDERCRCGLYAVKDPNLLRTARDPAVLGTVDLWGRIMEHALGFRAELAYPQRLGLVCCFCFWQRGGGLGAVEGVALGARRRLVPMCASHISIAARCGYRVDELLDPSAVLEVLLTAYAVEPIDRSLAAWVTSSASIRSGLDASRI